MVGVVEILCTLSKGTFFQARLMSPKRIHWQMFWFVQTECRRNEGTKFSQYTSSLIANASLLTHSYYIS
jgi:hypothetical protein